MLHSPFPSLHLPPTSRYLGERDRALSNLIHLNHKSLHGDIVLKAKKRTPGRTLALQLTDVNQPCGGVNQGSDTQAASKLNYSYCQSNQKNISSPLAPVFSVPCFSEHMTGVFASEETLPGYKSQGKMHFHTSFDWSRSAFALFVKWDAQ